MRLGEIATVKQWLATDPTASDPIWKREAGAISETELQLFYARAGLAGKRQAAIDAIDRAQASVILATVNGELVEAPSVLIMHEPPESPYMVDEFLDSLIKLRPARRRACLFALETHSKPEDVTSLSWAVASKMRQGSKVVQEILEVSGRTRHLRLPYVFWEWSTPQIATPLLELKWSIERAFDCSWPKLVHRYRNMIMVNRSAEATSLLELVEAR